MVLTEMLHGMVKYEGRRCQLLQVKRYEFDCDLPLIQLKIKRFHYPFYYKTVTKLTIKGQGTVHNKSVNIKMRLNR